MAVAGRHSASATDLRSLSRQELEQELEIMKQRVERLQLLSGQEQEDDDQKDPDLEPCDLQILGRMRSCFSNLIIPSNVLPLFHLYNSKVLTEKDMQKVRQVTENDGDIEGATILFDRLRHYPGWYQCLLTVLQEPTLKMTHVAWKMVKISGIPPGDDSSLHHIEDFETSSASSTFLKREMTDGALFSDGYEESDGGTGQGAGKDESMQITKSAQISNNENWQQQVASLKDQLNKMEEEKQRLLAQIAKLEADAEISKKNTKRLEQQLEEERAQHASVAGKNKEAQGKRHQQTFPPKGRRNKDLSYKENAFCGDVADELPTVFESTKTEVDMTGMNRQQADAKSKELYSRSIVGFKARMPTDCRGYIVKGEKVKSMTEVMQDSHEKYDKTTGIFEVPVSGWYKITLNHSQRRDGYGRIVLQAVHEKQSILESYNLPMYTTKEVVETSTRGRANDADIGPKQLTDSKEEKVYMKEGEKLWVCVAAVDSNEKLATPSSISCILDHLRREGASWR